MSPILVVVSVTLFPVKETTKKLQSLLLTLVPKCELKYLLLDYTSAEELIVAYLLYFLSAALLFLLVDDEKSKNIHFV